MQHYIAGTSENLNIPFYLKPGNTDRDRSTLRTKLPAINNVT